MAAFAGNPLSYRVIQLNVPLETALPLLSQEAFLCFTRVQTAVYVGRTQNYFRKIHEIFILHSLFRVAIPTGISYNIVY